MSDYQPITHTFSRGHTDDCWKWHMECARKKILELQREVDDWKRYVEYHERDDFSW